MYVISSAYYKVLIDYNLVFSRPLKLRLTCYPSLKTAGPCVSKELV